MAYGGRGPVNGSGKCVCVRLRVEAPIYTASRSGSEDLTQHQLRRRSDMVVAQGQRSSACVLT